MSATVERVRAPESVPVAAARRRSGPSYVFIIGTGRCGSTVLAETVCRHPDVGFISNIDERFPRLTALTRWNNAIYRRFPSGGVVHKRFIPSEAYGLLDREVSPILSSPFRDLKERDAGPWLSRRVEECFARRAAAQHAPIFLHKFTGWPRASFLHRTFPSARFVHIVRDGRAVANSWLQMPWWRGFGGPERWQWGPLPPHLAREWERADRSFVVLAGLLWRMLIEAYDVAREALPDESWLEIRYEDLTARPDEVLREILGFSGLRWCTEFDEGFDRGRLHATRVDAFRRDLDPVELARMTAAIEPTLTARGYAPD
ncbi:MAG TPA: sulfotransferase [Solirubrobacteraceae bacterium]|nr:sulfotransferase [Solirubrobacteraceae bacterium]